MLAEWYHPNVGTPYEVSPMPWLYNKYVGHDNNRDSFMGNMTETQYLNKIVNEIWFPQVLYNHHQTAPFPARIWIHPASEPQLSNVHPLLVRWQNLFGTAMGAAFDRAGQDGAISRTVFDSWYPGYVTQVADPHNVISQMTETALYRIRDAAFLHAWTTSPRRTAISRSRPSIPSPWKGGWWRLRDAVEYCLTASKAVLQMASAYRQELLFDRYQMGRDTIARFKKEPPYAWIVPQEQWDLPTAVVMLVEAEEARHRRLHGRQAVHLRRPLLPGGHVDHPDDAAVRALRQDDARRAAIPGPDQVPRRVAGPGQPAGLQGRLPAALRHGGLDAASIRWA